MIKNNGFVKTLFGRKININGYKDKNPMVRNYAYRQAINAPIQGAAADIIKRAMIKFKKIAGEDVFKNTKLLLQVHDELIFEVPKESEKNFTNLIRQEMTSVKDSDLHSFSTPLTVDVNSGDNWGLLD